MGLFSWKKKEERSVRSMPAYEFRAGDVLTSVWLNRGRNGTYYRVTFRRISRNQDGPMVFANGFYAGDLQTLALAVFEAERWISEQTKPLKQNGAGGPGVRAFVANKRAE